MANNSKCLVLHVIAFLGKCDHIMIRTHTHTHTHTHIPGGGCRVYTIWKLCECVWPWLSDRRDDKVSPQTVFSGQKVWYLPALLLSSSQKQQWDLPHTYLGSFLSSSWLSSPSSSSVFPSGGSLPVFLLSQLQRKRKNASAGARSSLPRLRPHSYLQPGPFSCFYPFGRSPAHVSTRSLLGPNTQTKDEKLEEFLAQEQVGKWKRRLGKLPARRLQNKTPSRG